MDILNLIVHFLENYPHLSYLILFIGSFFETLIGPGFFIYGEFIFLAGSILAGAGFLNIWIVSLACILGGIIGDSASFFIGRVYGKKLINSFIHKRNRFFNEKNYNKGRKFFDRYGVKSVFLARFLGPLSWVTPFIAGIAGVKYKKFLKYNIPGVALGIGQFLIVGYLFGFSYLMFLKKIKAYILLFLILVIIIFIIFILKERIKGKDKKK